MTKFEFDEKIRRKLELEGADAERLIARYNRLFAQKMEDGGDETDIIADFGTVDEIVADYLAERGLSPVGRFVKDKKQATSSWVNEHTGFLHNRTFWLIYFCGFIITFPLTVALFALMIGLFGGAVGILIAMLALYIALYIVSFALPIYGAVSLISLIFNSPGNFTVSIALAGLHLAAIGFGLLMIALTVHTQKRVNELFRRKGGENEQK
jgi:uncharacterized membrane protein